MADRIVTAAGADRTPNWDKWQRMTKPALWQCVALSLNIDPDKLKKDAFGFPESVSDKFRDRIDVTCATLSERHPADCAPIVQRSPLSLRKFAGWVREFEWDAPPELLGLGDQRPQDIDWNYWTTLDLWPIDVACKLVCGVNPNEPTRREDIENPDTLTRPAWVNLFHKAQAAVMSGKLRVQAGCVYPAELVVWAQGKGIQIPGGLGRLNLTTDQPSVEAGSSPRHSHKEERDTAIFRTMTELKWSEVSITFIEPEAVRIKARGESKTLTYEAMGFKNHQSRIAKPNKVWDTLRALAIVASTSKTLTDTLPPRTDFKRRVSRLRRALQEFFGIKDEPIPYGTTYVPAFILTAEEQVIRHVRDQTVPDDEDEDIAVLMSRLPGR